MTEELSETEKAKIDGEPLQPQKPSAYARSRYEYSYRLRVVLTVIPGLIGLLILLVPADFWYRLNPMVFRPTEMGGRSVSITLFAVLSFGISALGVIMFYLQTGFKRDFREREQLLDYESQFKLKNADLAESTRQVIAGPVRALEDRLAKLERTDQNPLITESDRQKLVAEIARRLEAEGSSDLLRRLEAQAQERFVDNGRYQMIDSQFDLSSRRLNGEITALGRRGNLNLGLGIITTVAGLGLLGYFVIRTASEAEQASAFAIHFIPRVSLVLFVEIFAYFFLKLYKSTLLEIKYFQNEMTNIEAKYTGLRTAFQIKNPKVAELVIRELASTERNYLLKKGETTVQLEQQKHDSELAAEISKPVTDAVRLALRR